MEKQDETQAELTPTITSSASEALLRMGIDVGSTTVKVVVLDHNNAVICALYERHHAHQIETACALLDRAATSLSEPFATANIRIAVTGSGGKELAEALDVPYIQEVIANSIAVAADYPQARVAIELGGQDAKMIFFEAERSSLTKTSSTALNDDEATASLAAGLKDGAAANSTAGLKDETATSLAAGLKDEAAAKSAAGLKVSDMRMNGSCAGGTGAFLDEIATLLKVPVEELDALAAKGSTLYSISGRCGVFAKTDIQPLINQGAAKEDIALSTFHAVAKQTLGGLAQGLEVIPPVIFEGGPLTFNPTLVRVFTERLHISGQDIIIPQQPETIVARGAALSLDRMFDKAAGITTIAAARKALKEQEDHMRTASGSGKPFFASREDLNAFQKRHAARPLPQGPTAFAPGSTVQAYLGIDSGSTTTKFALLDPTGHLIDSFYANNEGEPLDVACQALGDMQQRWHDAQVDLDILGCATTGYGELLFAKAFHADCHVVETVAHALAAARYVTDATFILDIGGQDMKAIWIDDGIVTDILVNEACSSGCGSFLENFARTLGIKTHDIAAAAFNSKTPAELGSRCTVFMNSSVVTEQKNGKSPEDIMAGLCRSIIENVFTKVVRVPNLDSLGERIVVQGGTFANDAVLAAFEDYVGRSVTRAPYPGLMGAIGAGLFALRHAQRAQREGTACLQSTFIGLNGVRSLSYEQTANVICPFCANNCARSVTTFSDGSTWVTGNRCERGQIVGDPHNADVRKQVSHVQARKRSVPNLFTLRQQLLMKDYPIPDLFPSRNLTIGIPRVLAFWDTMPFWTTFWRTLGFTVTISQPSSRTMFEAGLPAVASDTICFPAKLVHGHIRDLERERVDRIFMPSITTVPSENTEDTSESMCAVVKGYAIVLRNSDNPEHRSNVVLDAPLWHWYSDADRSKQLGAWMKETFDIDQASVNIAIATADEAMTAFKTDLEAAGIAVMEKMRQEGGYAVVLASRPYHNDPLVNHNLPDMFTDLGIPVLVPDAVPGVNEVDLSKSRLDIVNNYHARMLSCALLAARDPHLEYAQLVSFGCGHDAYLSDEIVRLTHETVNKSPLILKVDESDVPGPLRIRIRSFVETINIKRQEQESDATYAHDTRPKETPRTTQRPFQKQTFSQKPTFEANEHPLPDPYPVKFTKEDRRQKIILIPNTSHAFSRLMAAVFAKQGVRAIAMDIGREEAIRLGKKYVHNDICFPAQITIGEALAELESGKYDGMDVAVGTGKYIGDCRLTHYGALLRKALDEAGYAHIPIVTNDDADYHNLHPGFKMSIPSAARIAYGLPMIDALEELLRKMRPYELVKGAADAAFEAAVDALMDGMEHGGMRGAKRGFAQAIDIMKDVAYDRSHVRPRVLIVGEYLLNFHPGANHDVELYLEKNGFEVIEAKMADVIRKTYFYKDAQISEYDLDKPLGERSWYKIANNLFEHAHNVCDRIASAHPLYEPATRMPDLVVESDPIIHHTFDAGEGVLIPGEIIHHANHGCESFLILQPFGCLPNHIVGRGIVKRLRELYPSAQILSLDYDPDVSFANIENRLQMLIMNAKAHEHKDTADSVDTAASADTKVKDNPEQIPTLSEVSDTVAKIARDEQDLMQQILSESNRLEDDDTLPFFDRARHTAARMRAALEREDQLVTRAKEALTDARIAARVGAATAADEASSAASSAATHVTQAALRTYEIARDMRSRTNKGLSIAAALNVDDSTEAAPKQKLAEIQNELRAHADDARVFAGRIKDEIQSLLAGK